MQEVDLLELLNLANHLIQMKFISWCFISLLRHPWPLLSADYSMNFLKLDRSLASVGPQLRMVGEATVYIAANRQTFDDERRSFC